MLIKNLISIDDRKIIKDWFYLNKNKNLDFQVPGTLCIRQDKFLFYFLSKYKSVLENKTGYLLKEKYNGIRLYTKGYSLNRHIDNASNFALSIVVYQSDDKDNPLIFYTNPISTVLLKEGDGVYFKGMELEHERPPVKSDELLQLYLGYDILKPINTATLI